MKNSSLLIKQMVKDVEYYIMKYFYTYLNYSNPLTNCTFVLTSFSKEYKLSAKITISFTRLSNKKFRLDLVDVNDIEIFPNIFNNMRNAVRVRNNIYDILMEIFPVVMTR